MKNKIELAKKEVIKILTKDQPQGSNLTKEKIALLADTLIKNYLTKRESA